MKFRKGSTVVYKTSSPAADITGVVTDTKNYVVNGNNLQLVKVVFQTPDLPRGVYAAYDETGDGLNYYVDYISGDRKAPAHIEVVDE